MTNRELADRLENWPTMESEMFVEAARRLRELPEPTPEPVKDLRRLVERHECLSRDLKYHGDPDGPCWAWKDEHGGWSRHTKGQCIKIVRGIVKGLCGPYYWDLSIDRRHKDKWYTNAKMGLFDTELEAIDALLTAMRTEKDKPC